MRRLDSPEDIALLKAYLKKSVDLGSARLGDVSPRSDVTVLMYFFWKEDLAEEKWFEFEGAMLETWRSCGLLKTVIVSNTLHQCLQRFAKRFDNVEIQIEQRLVPGDIISMSYDCNSRLYQRFDTDYVLIVQNDGFPLRRGLDEFVEARYDFIGAPHSRPHFLPSLLTKLLRYCPSNGGFSLRTRKLCEMGAKLWDEGDFEQKPYVDDVMAEDYFFTKTLPLSGFGYWLRRNQASSSFSDYFSYGATFPLTSKRLPFGFHTATGFAALVRRFGDSILSVNS
jgi:hypothetical protein